MLEGALELIKLGIVGLIAGVFSSVITNRDHRKQQWWELRVEAYKNAIECLSDLNNYYDIHYEAHIEGRELPNEFAEKLSKEWHNAFPKIRKMNDAGAFLFSERANEALKKFIASGQGSLSHFEHLDERSAAARECLKTMVDCSKIDLRLSS